MPDETPSEEKMILAEEALRRLNREMPKDSDVNSRNTERAQKAQERKKKIDAIVALINAIPAEQRNFSLSEAIVGKTSTDEAAFSGLQMFLTGIKDAALAAPTAAPQVNGSPKADEPASTTPEAPKASAAPTPPNAPTAAPGENVATRPAHMISVDKALERLSFQGYALDRQMDLSAKTRLKANPKGTKKRDRIPQLYSVLSQIRAHDENYLIDRDVLQAAVDSDEAFAGVMAALSKKNEELIAAAPKAPAAEPPKADEPAAAAPQTASPEPEFTGDDTDEDAMNRRLIQRGVIEEKPRERMGVQNAIGTCMNNMTDELHKDLGDRDQEKLRRLTAMTEALMRVRMQDPKAEIDKELLESAINDEKAFATLMPILNKLGPVPEVAKPSPSVPDVPAAPTAPEVPVQSKFKAAAGAICRSLPSLAIGMATGYGVRMGMQAAVMGVAGQFMLQGALITLPGGILIGAVVGAVAGAAVSAVTTLLTKQRFNKKVFANEEERKAYEAEKIKYKAEFKKKFWKAVRRGAIVGAVGGATGGAATLLAQGMESGGLLAKALPDLSKPVGRLMYAAMPETSAALAGGLARGAGAIHDGKSAGKVLKETLKGAGLGAVGGVLGDLAYGQTLHGTHTPAATHATGSSPAEIAALGHIGGQAVPNDLGLHDNHLGNGHTPLDQATAGTPEHNGVYTPELTTEHLKSHGTGLRHGASTGQGQHLHPPSHPHEGAKAPVNPPAVDPDLQGVPNKWDQGHGSYYNEYDQGPAGTRADVPPQYPDQGPYADVPPPPRGHRPPHGVLVRAVVDLFDGGRHHGGPHGGGFFHRGGRFRP
jgi:hypothetical protein